MSTSDSKVVVNHVSDLSSSKKPILFLGFLFLQSDLLFELEFWMILFKAEATLASSISKVGNLSTAIVRDDFNSSTESTITTSLIHNIESEGKSDQELTWVLNLIFQNIDDDGVVNLSNGNSDICGLCCPAIEFCGISADIKKSWLTAFFQTSAL